MEIPRWLVLLDGIGRGALVLVCLLFLSWLWSFVVPGLTRLLEVTAARVRTGASQVARGILEWFRDHLSRYLIARRQEPRRPTLTAIAELREVLEGSTKSSLVEIRTLQRDLDRTVATAQRLTPGGAVVGKGPEQPRRGKRLRRASIAGIVVTLLAAAAVGAFNATLLNIFFREVLGSVRLLPYPLPDLQVSLALGIIFFLLEIYVGHLLGQAQGEGDESRTSSFMQGFVPWFGLIVLAGVETAAYALLSRQVDLPRRLSIDPTSPLYGLAAYFLAFLGAGITLILAGLGYAASRQVERYRAQSDELAFERLIKASVEASATHADRLEDVEAALQRIKAEIEAIPGDIGRRAAEGLGSPEERVTVLATIDGRLKRLTPNPEEGNTLPLIRTGAQVFSELGVQLFMLVVLALSLLASVWMYQALLQAKSRLNPNEALALGSLISIAVVALGFFLRDLRGGGRRGALIRSAAAGEAVRSLWVLLTVLGIVVLTSATALAATTLQLLGDSPTLNSAFGVGLGLVLTLLGGVLDLVLTGLLDLLLLCWIGLAWVIGRLIDLLGWLTQILLDALRFIADLMAMPGGWIRTARNNA